MATGRQDELADLYLDCIKNMRRRLPGVVRTADFGPRTKVKMVLQGLFPVRWAARELKKENAARERDFAAMKEA